MKKIFAVLLSFVMAMLMVSCATEEAEVDKKDDKKEKENVTVNGVNEDDVDGTENLTNDSEKDKEENNTEKESEMPSEPEKDDSYIGTELFLEEGNVVSVEDVAEFTLESTVITDDVKPSDTSSYYSHYEADKGTVFADICIKYKNLNVSAVSCDDAIDINTAYYRGQYQYNGFVVTEDADGSGFSSYDSIDPLETKNIHCLIKLPEIVKDSDGEVVVLLDIGENTYAVIVRDGTLGTDTSVQKDAEEKDSGEITTGEIIEIKNECYFNVIDAEFVNDVLPPDTDGVYSHYEAKEGKSYLCVRVAYLNIANKAEDIDDCIDGTMKYMNKYEYSGFPVIVDGDQNGFSSYGSFIALKEECVYMLFEVPQEVADSEDSVVVTFEICDNTYTYSVR